MRPVGPRALPRTAPGPRPAHGHPAPDTSTHLATLQGSPHPPSPPVSRIALAGHMLRSSPAWVSCPSGPKQTPTCWCLWKSYRFFSAQQTQESMKILLSLWPNGMGGGDLPTSRAVWRARWHVVQRLMHTRVRDLGPGTHRAGTSCARRNPGITAHGHPAFESLPGWRITSSVCRLLPVPGPRTPLQPGGATQPGWVTSCGLPPPVVS